MRIRMIQFGTWRKSRKGSRRSAPSGMMLGAVATVLLAGVAWVPTAGVTRPQSHLAPVDYSMPHKNADPTGETPTIIKRAPVQVRPDPDATIRVDFSAPAAPGQRQTKGKRT